MKLRILGAMTVVVTAWTSAGVPVQAEPYMLSAAKATVKVHYKSFDDIKLDGEEAYGRVGRMRMWRGNTEADKVSLYPVAESAGIDWIDLTFSKAFKPKVKLIPPDSLAGGRMVTFKIKGVDWLGTLQGEILSIE